MTETAMSDESLAVRSLAVRYGSAVALASVDLDAPKGGRIGVIGRNGAGKSTLLRSIAGGLRPAAGTIHWNGEDITRLSTAERVRRGIAIVLEGGRNFPLLSVEENLRFGAIAGNRRARGQLELVLDLFPVLRSRFNLRAGQLSGGEAQMLAIGQALMASPRLLLLDEPSIGLAPTAVASLLEALRNLASGTGISLVLVEQSLRLAVEFSDEIYLLRNGRSEHLGSPHGSFDVDNARAAYFT